MKYISPMKMNKLLLHTTWNNLTNIKADTIQKVKYINNIYTKLSNRQN